MFVVGSSPLCLILVMLATDLSSCCTIFTYYTIFVVGSSPLCLILLMLAADFLGADAHAANFFAGSPDAPLSVGVFCAPDVHDAHDFCSNFLLEASFMAELLPGNTHETRKDKMQQDAAQSTNFKKPKAQNSTKDRSAGWANSVGTGQ